MKNIFKWYGFVVFIVVTQSSIAQQHRTTKPALFTNFPATIHCTGSQLGKLFLSSKGQNIKLTLTDDLVLQGPVKSKISKYGKIETVNVQLPAFDNMMFSLSKSIDENNNIIYTAHLFNSKYADGYQLKRTDKNMYQFEKIAMETMLPACNQ